MTPAIIAAHVSGSKNSDQKVVVYHPVVGKKISFPLLVGQSFEAVCDRGASEFARKNGLSGEYVRATISNPTGYMYIKKDYHTRTL